MAQKRPITHDDFDDWNRIRQEQISNDGEYVIYHVAPGRGDVTLKITGTDGKEKVSFSRAENGGITWGSGYVIFSIKTAMDSLNSLRRKKVKDQDLPKDSLGIYNLKTEVVTKISNVKSFKAPQKWDGHIAYLLEDVKIKKDTASKDTTQVKTKKKKVKKVNKKNGFHLVLRNLSTGQQDTMKYVLDYTFAEKGKALLYTTTGVDSTILPGVYYHDISKKNTIPLTRSKGKYKQLRLSKDGLQAAFLVDRDTTKALERNFELRYWTTGLDSAMVKADRNSDFLEGNWVVNENGGIMFSEDGKRLFYGTSPAPLVQDTTLLPEEIIKVEVWNYQNGRLHTQQNAELENDKKKSYWAVMNTETFSSAQLANTEIPELQITEHATSRYGLGISNVPYQQYISWEGWPRHNDYYRVDLASGEKKLIAKDVRGSGDISAEGNYAFWYNAVDSTWYTYNNETNKTKAVSKQIPTSMADELNDAPNLPGAYGVAGWTKNDKYLLIYDRYDIWRVDPDAASAPVNLTNGRKAKQQFRYIDLDDENEAIDLKNVLLSVFDETTRNSGFYNLKSGKTLKQLVFDNHNYRNVAKAQQSDEIIFSKENHELFPDLLTSDISFKKQIRLSNVNPQQKDLLWGSVELYNWTSLDGLELEGLLYKPANFDPNKKYPMITYFYERNSNNLNRHWGAVPIRSIVNPTFYASNGYIIFIPDIVYREGYAGESCYNAVIPGVTQLIAEGFVDEDKIGVQGHSWGGYQAAYLVTRTNIFAAAEAGAPVANMISAYGGIRWWTGLSRMFQYEHTQSRIGGSLWEYPLRYIENSPIFYIDKVQTPLLIMHNDADGHVPWYQGIELYVSLRRLGKPAWMLNYNGEPHWPTKWENIRDFNIRMHQYFDHYLKDKPMPEWMDKGIPAIEKGINNGYKLVE
ncbi:MAG: prolyl oligopeptidase family serine peptidase [Bacteroidota bacterium]